jgi:3-hydroxyisobutyrate dehydrogenase-like beta-hydroxyacid dehydrogenase
MTPTKKIAFVGLGNMGAPMAARLAASGLWVAVYDMRSRVLARKFAAGMALGLIAKYLSTVANFGYSIDALTPLADCVSRTWGKAVVAIGGEADQTEVARLSEESN